MYYVELNDASLFEVTEIIKETTTKLKGVTLKAIEMELQNADIELVRSAFSSEFNTRTVKLLSEKKITMTVYDGYSILRSIATNEQDLNENPEKPKYTVVLAMTSDISSLVPQLQERIAELEAEIITLTAEPDPSQMDLDQLKEYMISMSKMNLDVYLSEHPVVSTCHAGVEAEYTCTLEKQTLLNSAIAMAEIHNKLGTAYQASWNARGEECTYDWTLDELIMLAIDIEAFVKPLVSAQQSMESKINAATTKEEVFDVSISFDNIVIIIPEVTTPEVEETPVEDGTNAEENVTEDEVVTENDATEETLVEETPAEEDAEPVV